MEITFRGGSKMLLEGETSQWESNLVFDANLVINIQMFYTRPGYGSLLFSDKDRCDCVLCCVCKVNVELVFLCFYCCILSVVTTRRYLMP